MENILKDVKEQQVRCIWVSALSAAAASNVDVYMNWYLKGKMKISLV